MSNSSQSQNFPSFRDEQTRGVTESSKHVNVDPRCHVATIQAAAGVKGHHQPAQCVFIGTTVNLRYLKHSQQIVMYGASGECDETGNSRHEVAAH